MIAWKSLDNGVSQGTTGMLGKFSVFSIYWYVADDRNKPYRLSCCLPGLKTILGSFPSENDAKEYAIKAYTLWLQNVGLIDPDGVNNEQ